VEATTQNDVERFKINGDLRAVTVAITNPGKQIELHRRIVELAARVCEFLSISPKKRPRALAVNAGDDIDFAKVASAIEYLMGELDDGRTSADETIAKAASRKEAAVHRSELKSNAAEFLKDIRDGADATAAADGYGTLYK
jgi:hypothetical protein